MDNGRAVGSFGGVGLGVDEKRGEGREGGWTVEREERVEEERGEEKRRGKWKRGERGEEQLLYKKMGITRGGGKRRRREEGGRMEE
jgi:hypothetical protein